MGALRKYKPSLKDQRALRDFIDHRRGLSHELEQLLLGVAETKEAFFFFEGNTREFSTEEAAQILNVSRPFLIKILDEGKIIFRKVGKHRRVNAVSLMKFKDKQDEENQKILDELTEIAQKHNLGY